MDLLPHIFYDSLFLIHCLLLLMIFPVVSSRFKVDVLSQEIKFVIIGVKVV